MSRAPASLPEAALLHVPDQPFAYGVGPRTLRVIVRLPAGAVTARSVAYNDRYAWERADYAPLRRTAALWLYARDGETEYWAADLRLERPRFRYRFALEVAGGTRWFGWDGLAETASPTGAFEYAYLTEGDAPDVPDWAKGATFYHVFPDRFERARYAHGASRPAAWRRPPTRRTFLGGDLDGIVARLDHIAALSVDALYLTPIFAAPSAHRYDTADYFAVDERSGGNLALRRLVEAVHERGMRLILDGVFNHAGATWPPFVDVRRRGRRSRYARWFHLDDDDGAATRPAATGAATLGYETWATDVASLPKLRTTEPEVRELVCRIGRFWIEEYGVDGWRLDVASEVDHGTWRAFRSAVRAAAADAFIVGEVWHPAMPWLRGDQFDSVMDYPLREAIIGFAGTASLDAAAFLDRVDRSRAAYPEPIHHSLYGLLGSHDAERPLTACRGDRSAFAVAVALRYALPGIVSIYYGDEVGMEGGDDPGCRAGMPWDDERQDGRLLDLHQRLGRLRRVVPALRSGAHRRLYDDGAVAAFVRDAGGRRVAVVANAGAEDAVVPRPVIADALGGRGRVLGTFGYHDAHLSVRRRAIAAPARSVTFIASRGSVPA